MSGKKLKTSRKKFIALIKLLAIVSNEIVLDFFIGDFSFNSIEWVKEKNKIILHKFEEGDIDLEYDFDQLPNNIKRELYLFLIRNFLN